MVSKHYLCLNIHKSKTVNNLNMKQTFTNTVWKYLLVVLFISLGASAQAQTPSVAIVPSGPIVCAGTKLDAITTNLVGPYIYLWSTGATTSSIVVTQTGFYRVSVLGTFNGSTRKVRSNWVPLFVIPLTNASIAANGSTNLCPGENVILTANGGQFFSNYLWSNGSSNHNITVNTTGDYSVTISNNFGSCNTSTTATIHVQSFDSTFIPNINAVGPITVCKPGYVHLTADSGFSGYSWSTGATTQNVNILMDGLQQGPVLDTLTVYLTVQINNSCEFTNPNGIVVRSIREPKLTTASCGNFNYTSADSIHSEVVLTYLNFIPQYEFEFEETTQPGITWTYLSNTRWANFANVTPALQPGSFYNVRVRAVIGGTPYCYGNVCQIGLTPLRLSNVNATQAIRTDGTSLDALVFPNPSSESFKLVIRNLNADQSTSVRVSDVSGRLVHEYKYDTTSESLQFGQELSNGIYFVTVEQGDAKSVTRVVKTN